MKLRFVTSQLFRQTLLVLLLGLAIFVASTGGFQNPRWDELFGGIAVSVLSAVVCIYFLQGIDKKPEIDKEKIAQAIREGLGQLNQSHFVRADRNMDMGDQYWVGLIEQLVSSTEPVFFVGTRLSWWLRTRAYREPLRAKLLERFKLISRRYEKSGQDSDYMIYVLLANSEWVPQWREFFREIIDELSSVKDATRRNQLQELFWGKTMVGTLPQELVRYSLVLCGDRLAVTYYTSAGRSEDSPTLEINKTSMIRKLYLDDLEILKRQAHFETTTSSLPH